MTLDEKRQYDRDYHAKRSPEQKQAKLDGQRARAKETITALRAFKGLKGCADCGESDPIVLDFDHRDQATKSFNIGDVARLGWSLKKALAEAEKCDVVCANCHRRRTAKQLGWHTD